MQNLPHERVTIGVYALAVAEIGAMAGCGTAVIRRAAGTGAYRGRP
jgi:hypothetical protein